MTQNPAVWFSLYLQFPTNHSKAPYLEGSRALVSVDTFKGSSIRDGTILQEVTQELMRDLCCPEFPQNGEHGLSAIIKGLYVSALILVPYCRKKGSKSRLPVQTKKGSSRPEEMKSLSFLCLSCRLFHFPSLSFGLPIFIEKAQWPSSAVNRIVLVEGDCFLPYAPNNDSDPVKAAPPNPHSLSWDPLLGSCDGWLCWSRWSLCVLLCDLYIFYYVWLLVLFRWKLFLDYHKGCPLLNECS